MGDRAMLGTFFTTVQSATNGITAAYAYIPLEDETLVGDVEAALARDWYELNDDESYAIFELGTEDQLYNVVETFSLEPDVAENLIATVLESLEDTQETGSTNTVIVRSLQQSE
jgi:hypothetical protein